MPGDDHFPFLGDQASVFAAIAPFLAGLSGNPVTIELTWSDARALRDLLARHDPMGQTAALHVEDGVEGQALATLRGALEAQLGSSGTTGPTG